MFVRVGFLTGHDDDSTAGADTHDAERRREGGSHHCTYRTKRADEARCHLHSLTVVEVTLVKLVACHRVVSIG